MSRLYKVTSQSGRQGAFVAADEEHALGLALKHGLLWSVAGATAEDVTANMLQKYGFQVLSFTSEANYGVLYVERDVRTNLTNLVLVDA